MRGSNLMLGPEAAVVATTESVQSLLETGVRTPMSVHYVMAYH
jgi:hypothetical protein